jgi:hypothetical protein
MSEEIIENNGAVENPTASNETVNPETEQQEQQPQSNTDPNPEKGGEGQKEEEKKPIYTKVGREILQKVTFYKDDARNALAREVSESTQSRKAKIVQKQELIEKFNRDLAAIEAEIKALETEIITKSEIAVTGEKREDVLCDVYQTENEIIYIPEGSDFEKGEVIARSQRTPEQKEEEK